MAEFRKQNVCTKVKLTECSARTGKKLIGVRWVDIDKGDDKNPKYRSRLVAKELNLDKRDDLFAATPLVEAKKLLLSLALTEGYGFERHGGKPALKMDLLMYEELSFMPRAEGKFMLSYQTKMENLVCVVD